VPFKIIRQPGVRQFASNPAIFLENFRGMTYIDGTIYVAYNNHLVRFTEGSPTFIDITSGNLVMGGGGPVFFARDQNQPPHQIMVPASIGGAFVFTGAAITPTPITNVATAVDVVFGTGFFFYLLPNGRVYASSLPNTPDAVPFADANSKPDGALRLIYFGDQLYIMGRESIEIWGKPINTGAGQFPLNRIAVIPRGMISNKACTGFENGIDLGVVFVGNNHQVCRLNGYVPERISNPDIERLIEATIDKTKIECTSYFGDNHAYCKVRTNEWCWTYDYTTQTWQERQSWQSVTSRLLQATYTGTRWLVGDADTPVIGHIRPETRQEYARPLVWQVDAVPTKGFPNRVVVGPAHFELVVGVGEIDHIDGDTIVSTINDVTITNPRLEISWSDDGGENFTIPEIRELGVQRNSQQLIRTFLTGSFSPYGRVWRLRCSDPVYISLLDGDMPRIKQRGAA
jgi:hypothetical protein